MSLIVTIDFLSAMLVGLLGAGHCLGMCGGISTMLTSAMASTTTNKSFRLTIGYNFGRIASYAFIGAIVGFTGSIAAKSIGLPLVILRVVSAIFMIVLGLYLGQWLNVLVYIEKLGQKLWRRLAPASKKLLPVKNLTQATLLGALWGWLPCGLVYSALTWSLASGNALNGAMLMLAFGLGTLPAMLTVSWGTLSVKQMLSNKAFRKISAILIICYGFYSLNVAFSLMF